MDILSKLIIPGTVFLLALFSGWGLSRSGKPYRGFLFNIHKLTALGVVILAAVPIFNLLKNAEFQGFVILLVILTGVCVIALFVTGAMMSLEKLNYNLMLVIHRTAPAMAVIALAVLVYLLAGETP